MSEQVEKIEVAPGEVVSQRIVAVPESRAHRIGIAAVLVGAGLVCALAMGLSAGSSTSTIGLNSVSGISLHSVLLPPQPTCMALGVVIILLGVLHLVRGLRGRALTAVGIVAGVLFVLSFLVWTGSEGNVIQLTDLLRLTVVAAAPLILGAMSGVLCERTGVINIAIEGQMLVAAFAGALFGSIAGSWFGLVAAVMVGAIMGSLLAVFAIKFMVNQIILGVVLNVLALGMTGYLYKTIMANDSGLNDPGVFQPIKIPGLGDIPVIGPVLFNQSIIVYLMYAVVIVIDVALVRTKWGLRTRAVGEHPKAADTVGINVLRLRYQNVILGGAVAGVAGAFLTIGNVGQFNENMTNGRGFIALAAVIFGRWTPRGAVVAALFFGFADTLATQLSLLQMPATINANLLSMLPYLATVFAVAGLIGRVRAPAADGEPYVKGS